MCEGALIIKLSSAQKKWPKLTFATLQQIQHHAPEIITHDTDIMTVIIYVIFWIIIMVYLYFMLLGISFFLVCCRKRQM